MRFLSLMAMFATIVALRAEDPTSVAWSGDRAEAVKPPKIVRTPNALPGKEAFRAVVEAPGKYQGMTGTFSRPVDLSKYAAVEFSIRQNFWTRGKTHVVLRFDMPGRRFLYRDIVVGGEEWTHVSIPLEPSAWKTTEKLDIVFGPAVAVKLYPYAALNAPGQYMEIGGLHFVPKSAAAAERRLSVMSYRHRNTPTSGDAEEKTLTDGDLRKKNVFYREYSDDPDIEFDLGALQAIDRIAVHAFGPPSHNFSELTVLGSADGKEWSPVGVIRNSRVGSAPEALKFELKPSDIVARHLRIRASRLRPDFKISFTEFEFFGHTPSAAENAVAARKHYNNGPVMPPRSAKDYAVLKNQDFELYISRKNGVINGIFHRGKLIAERFSGFYQLQTRQKDFSLDGYQDVVSSIQVKPAEATLLFSNPGLPGMRFEKRIRLEKDAVLERITLLENKSGDRVFLRIGNEVILNREFRENTTFETWGAGHDLTRIPAGSILLDNAVANTPTVSIENPVAKCTILHHRFRFNNRFLHLDHVSEEDRLTIFRPNGYRMNLATIVPADKVPQSVEHRFAVTPGSLFHAYDAYLDLPEVRDFFARIRRPAWIRDVRMVAALGWDGMWEGAGTRYLKNIVNSTARGFILEPALGDLDDIWGDLPVEGDVRNWFGGRMTAPQLRDRIAGYKSLSPRVKIGIYTWLWSAFPWSTPAQNHPEWFVRKLRNGAPASWFPGKFGVNHMRFFGIPESRKEAHDQIMRMVKYYNLDVWYLDGGNSGAYAKDFESMRIDDPFGWTDLYMNLRRTLQESAPDRGIFFNVPCNPLGDIGFLESFSGALTSQWRKGAAWMWKFKLFQHRDPLHFPAYIYWLPGVDGVFHNYMTGTGLIPTLNSRNFSFRDLCYIAARYEVRQLALTDANVSPNWRADHREELEAMAMRQQNAGFVFLQRHGGTKPAQVGVDGGTLGLTDPKRPVHHWVFTIRDGRSEHGIFGETQLAASYRRQGWIAERAIVPEYLGTTPRQSRHTRTFTVKERQAKVWMMTQTPAFIRAIDGEPSHYLLPSQPGITVDGTAEKLTVHSEFDRADIGIITPPGMEIATLCINGRTVPATTLNDGVTRFTQFTVGRGVSNISAAWRKAPDQKTASLDVKLDKKTLKIETIPANVPFFIRHAGSAVYAGRTPCSIELPETVRDGRYEIHSGGLMKHIDLRGFARPMRLEPILKTLPVTSRVEPVAEGLHTGEAFNAKTSFAETDPAKKSVRAGTLPMYESHYNIAAAGLELKLKRFVKLELINQCKRANNFGLQPKHHFPRYDNPNCFGGLMLDFGTPGGYTVRTAVGFGKQNEKRTSPHPMMWGKKTRPDLIVALNDALHEDKLDRIPLWIDLGSLGAPMAWDGRVWMTMLLENLGPDRAFGFRVLDTADRLPPGEKVVVATPLSGLAEPKTLTIPPSPGPIADWSKVPELGKLSLVMGAGKTIATPTFVKLAHDRKNLYLYFDCRDVEGKIPVSVPGKPWFGDSVEFFLQYADRADRMLHIIADVDGNVFAERSDLSKQPGSFSEVLQRNPARCEFIRNPKGGYQAKIALPLSALGFTGDPAGKTLAFNMMRNRALSGNVDFFTLVPGCGYFSGNTWKLHFSK